VSGPKGNDGRGASARARLLTSMALGLIVGAAVSVPVGWRYGVLIGWICAAVVFLAWTWTTIWPMDAAQTANHASGENPGRAWTDIAMISAAVASLLAVGSLLSGGTGSKTVQAALSVCAVAVAWASVHTVFTTRYARLYYTDRAGGVDFNEDDPPCYADFAYLAFTIGMTFQVSDTDLKTKTIRATALRHGLLSYLFGAVIIATTINLVAGLSK